MPGIDRSSSRVRRLRGGAAGGRLVLLSLLAVAAAAMWSGDSLATEVTFTYRPAAGGTVYLAGTFNSWNPTATAMTDADGDGVHAVTLELAPGRYEYKFVVGGQWFTDESAAAFTDDGFGGRNSIIEVGGQALTTAGDAGTAAAGAAAAGTPAAAAAGGGPGAGGTPVTFRFQPVISGALDVFLAGTMNGWDASATRMTDDDGDGVYEVVLQLAPGRYEYKFVVGGEWFTDENAQDFADDGFGGRNSVITVGTTPARSDAAAVSGGGLRRVEFSYSPPAALQDCFLAGTFNEWSTSATRMTDDDGDGAYTVTLLLPPATYQYKFVADGAWTTDRTAAAFADDGFGGQNSVITVDDSFPAVEIERGDGRMFEEGVEHAQRIDELNRFADDRVEVRVRVHRNDVEHVELLVTDTTAGARRVLPMPRLAGDRIYDLHGTVVELADPPAPLRYAFRFRDGDAEFWLAGGGLGPTEPEAGEWFAYDPDAAPRFTTPEWVKDAVIYQIFPERFRNGDPANDPDFSETMYDGARELPASGKTNGEYFHLVKDWYDIAGLKQSPYRTDGKPDWFSFYGGDIQGVLDELDYLSDLGITAIYFNPIQKAKSNHKYDAADYLQIDPHFGSEALFKRFVQAAHQRGIHIILDTVFNHCGDQHWAFLDTREKGPDSAYWQWFEWRQWPLPDAPPESYKAADYYACWWGFASLPDLNFDLALPNPQENAVTDTLEAHVNHAVVDHLMRVVDYWLGDMDVDGFRLDVPNEVPPWYWKLFNRRVKTLKPDAYLVGELWGDASNWIRPDVFDATMNYAGFRDPVLGFLARGNIDAATFDRQLAAVRMRTPRQAMAVMMNLVGSHDTERLGQRLAGDVARQKLIALFAMTYVGAPQIYYGDEVGLMGGGDPDCRRPFPWNWQQNGRSVALHDWYRRVIELRRRHVALRRGDFSTLYAEGSAYAFLRSHFHERAIVALNASRQRQTIALDLAAHGFRGGEEFVELLGGGAAQATAGGQLELELGPWGAAVLVTAGASGD